MSPQHMNPEEALRAFQLLFATTVRTAFERLTPVVQQVQRTFDALTAAGLLVVDTTPLRSRSFAFQSAPARPTRLQAFHRKALGRSWHRTRSGGRGLTSDRVIFDEAFTTQATITDPGAFYWRPAGGGEWRPLGTARLE